MRPYMLWLARYYARESWLYPPHSRSHADVLGDWVKYQSEQRFYVDANRA